MTKKFLVHHLHALGIGIIQTGPDHPQLVYVYPDAPAPSQAAPTGTHLVDEHHPDLTILWTTIAGPGAVRAYAASLPGCQVAEARPGSRHDYGMGFSSDGLVKLCGDCQRKERSGIHLRYLAARNTAAAAVSIVKNYLGLPASHALSKPELIAYLVQTARHGQIPESAARYIANRPADTQHSASLGGTVLSDAAFCPPSSETFAKLEPVIELTGDATKPEVTFWRR